MDELRLLSKKFPLNVLLAGSLAEPKKSQKIPRVS